MSDREQQTARVHVDEATWQAFRIRAIQAGRSVANELGRLVRRSAPQPADRAAEAIDAGALCERCAGIHQASADQEGEGTERPAPPEAACRRPRPPDRAPLPRDPTTLTVIRSRSGSTRTLKAGDAPAPGTVPQAAGHVTTIAGGVGVTTDQFFSGYSEALGIPRPRLAPTTVVRPLMGMTGWAQERLGLTAVASRHAADLLCRPGTYDIDKARRLLGYEPSVGLDQGMERTADWLRAQGAAAEQHQTPAP